MLAATDDQVAALRRPDTAGNRGVVSRFLRPDRFRVHLALASVREEPGQQGGQIVAVEVSRREIVRR